MEDVSSIFKSDAAWHYNLELQRKFRTMSNHLFSLISIFHGLCHGLVLDPGPHGVPQHLLYYSSSATSSHSTSHYHLLIIFINIHLRGSLTTQSQTETTCLGNVQSLFLWIFNFQASRARIGAGQNPPWSAPTASVLKAGGEPSTWFPPGGCRADSFPPNQYQNTNFHKTKLNSQSHSKNDSSILIIKLKISGNHLQTILERNV